MLMHMKILNKFLLSLILIVGLGTTAFAVEQKLQIENDEPRTSVVYAVSANLSGKNFYMSKNC